MYTMDYKFDVGSNYIVYENDQPFLNVEIKSSLPTHIRVFDNEWALLLHATYQRRILSPKIKILEHSLPFKDLQLLVKGVSDTELIINGTNKLVIRARLGGTKFYYDSNQIAQLKLDTRIRLGYIHQHIVTETDDDDLNLLIVILAIVTLPSLGT
jgi:hypothetical protein